MHYFVVRRLTMKPATMVHSVEFCFGRKKPPTDLIKNSHSPTQLNLDAPRPPLLGLDEAVLSGLAMLLDMISCSNMCPKPKRVTAG